MSNQEEIAMLEKRLKELKAKEEVKKKVGFKEGLKRSFKIFGQSAGTVFKSVGKAGHKVLSDPTASTGQKDVNVEDILRKLPA